MNNTKNTNNASNTSNTGNTSNSNNKGASSKWKFSWNWKSAFFIKEKRQEPLRRLLDETESKVFLWIILLGAITLGLGHILYYLDVQRMYGLVALLAGTLFTMSAYTFQLVSKPRSVWPLAWSAFVGLCLVYFSAYLAILPISIMGFTIFVTLFLGIVAVTFSDVIKQTPHIAEGVGLCVACFAFFMLYLSPLRSSEWSPLIEKLACLGLVLSFFGMLVWQFVRARVAIVNDVKAAAVYMVRYGDNGVYRDNDIYGDKDVYGDNVASEEKAESEVLGISGDAAADVVETVSGYHTSYKDNTPADMDILSHYGILKYMAPICVEYGNPEEKAVFYKKLLDGKLVYQTAALAADPTIIERVTQLLENEQVVSNLYKATKVSTIRLAITRYVIFAGLFMSLLSLVLLCVLG